MSSIKDSVYGSPPLRSQKKQRRRERIVEAAVEAFNRKGFSATTMQQIAEVADLAVGTLYNYFPSKNDLLVGIIEGQMEEIRRIDVRELVRRLQNAGSGSEVASWILSTVIRKSFVLSKQNWREVFGAMVASRSELDRMVELDFEAIGLLAVLLRNMQKRGLVRKNLSADAAAMNLYSVAVVQFMAYAFVAGVGEEDLVMNLQQQIELAFSGLAPRPVPG
jgi:AcrR family transcriptional regulator